MLRPSLTVIGGPNGSGKTSVLEVLHQLGVEIPNYLNADDIAHDMSDDSKNLDEINRAAQIFVRQQRDNCIRDRVSVSYETVMSHPSHLDAMQQARDLGFYVRLIFITTADPQINVERVAHRVIKGGHDVPADKIKSRYNATMSESLHKATLIADEAMIWDNSFAAPHGRIPVAHVMGEYVKTFPALGLDWPEPHLISHLREANYQFAA